MSTVDHSDIRGSGAGPAVMVVIRRELPRTRDASPAKSLSHRTVEDSPFRVPLDRRLPCVHRFSSLRGSRLRRWTLRVGLRRHRLLDRHTDRPDEPKELACDSGHHLLLDLALPNQPAVTAVQSVLRLPGDRLDLFAEAFLPLSQGGSDRRSMLVSPGGFANDPAKMAVASLGDAALTSAWA